MTQQFYKEIQPFPPLGTLHQVFSCVLGMGSWAKSRSGEVSVLGGVSVWLQDPGHRLGPGHWSWAMSWSSEVTVLGVDLVRVGGPRPWLVFGLVQPGSWVSDLRRTNQVPSEPRGERPSRGATLSGSNLLVSKNLLGEGTSWLSYSLVSEPPVGRTSRGLNLLMNEPPGEQPSLASDPPGVRTSW